jgi:hypothetical protein
MSDATPPTPDPSQKLSKFLYYPDRYPYPRVVTDAHIQRLYTYSSLILLLAVSKESREYALKDVNFEFEVDVPNPLQSLNNRSTFEDLRGVAFYWDTIDADIPALRIQAERKILECITRLRFRMDVVFIELQSFPELGRWLPESFFQGVRYLAVPFETWLYTKNQYLRFTSLKELILFAEPSKGRLLWPTRDWKQDQKSRLEYMEESVPKRLERLTKLKPAWSKIRVTIFSDADAYIKASQ